MSLADYIRSIQSEHASGQATEHTYRPALKALLEFMGGDGVRAINEPTHGDYGAPDFIVERGDAPVGHVECKDIGANLDATELTGQLSRYRDALPNLILTDYLEFRWYTKGQLRDEARLGRFDAQGQWRPAPSGRADLQRLLANFFNARESAVTDPADLAQRMAGKARLLRDTIREALESPTPASRGLQDLLDSYRKTLISDLSAIDFADLQAQTAAYGLFAARCIHGGPAGSFTRQSASFAQTTPFLQEVFGHIAGPAADPKTVWIVDDLARLLAVADMGAILRDFGRRTHQEDPVVHFYEDFLRAYDPQLRELRGVYYTPEPIVSYIVRSVDYLLCERFGLADGLADTATIALDAEDGKTTLSPRVLILDPAAGTGTFLREAVARIRARLVERGQAGAWPDYVQRHLLPRLFGFELLMAPYAISHLKLALEIGGSAGAFQLPPGARLNVFLTNSLENAHPASGGALFARGIVEEARQADEAKQKRRVMVVIGNPPYSGHSVNKGAWIADLLRGRIEGSEESYFEVDGQPLGERNPKWLNDDYVKFLRFAQWRIQLTGEGILGFVTNHSYLDNPTFRGMRQSLMATFDEVYLLDLHGNSRKKERSPDGGPDKNVFDIQQGVAIGVFIKFAQSAPRPARVFHADLWGERGETAAGADGGKYGWLAAHDVASTKWTELAPKSPDYFFVPRDEELAREHQTGWRLTDILPVNSVGIVTARDRLAIRWSAEEMREVAADFAGLGVEEARAKYALGNSVPDARIRTFQADLISDPDADSHVQRILYRPLDTRWTYFTGKAGGFLERTRADVMRHMLAGENVGLIACRQQSGHGEWNLCGVTDAIVESAVISNRTREINYLFPLYLYPPEGGLLEPQTAKRRPNLSPEFIARIEAAAGLSFDPGGRGDLSAAFGPEDVFHYIYGILHSPGYRARYADFLKSDFPRIPLPPPPPPPPHTAFFREMAAVGERLVRLHLHMEAPAADRPAFPISGCGKVERVRYDKPTADAPGRVWINKTQYFEGVSSEAWGFSIGGYRPAEKWLSDRKGRTLGYEDIARYQQVCAVLAETPRLMQRADDVIAAHGGWPLGSGKRA